MPEGLLSVAEVAERLSVNPSRVRAMLASGVLGGEKVGGRWLVHDDSVSARERCPGERGRQLSAANAWGVLAIASGKPASWLSASKQRHIRGLLDERGLFRFVPRLRHRARRLEFFAHPGVLRHLAASAEIVRTGASAASAHELGLVAGDELDAYVAEASLSDLADRWALEPRRRNANLVLRALPDGLWPFDERIAPIAAVVVDLAENVDERSLRIGRHHLEALDRERRWSRAMARR
jgi:excisionase family DNA binding protein